MQNIIDESYINKVINIKSEILFREAEDDFYYFFQINSAAKKLKEALMLTPFHFKSLMLFADICFIKGYIKKALKFYKKAEAVFNKDFKVLSSIANCYNSLKKYDEAINYCNKAFKNFDDKNHTLLSQLIEIKIFGLINLKRYTEAAQTYEHFKKMLDESSIMQDYEQIAEKLKLQKKLAFSGLKIV